jgi:hypothetical protein
MPTDSEFEAIQGHGIVNAVLGKKSDSAGED